jgi:hypothetical protein
MPGWNEGKINFNNYTPLATARVVLAVKTYGQNSPYRGTGPVLNSLCAPQGLTGGETAGQFPGGANL